MYPFTKFLQLIEFCRYGDHRDTFGRYNLIALPFIGTGDKSVRNSLKQNFERLHVTTGRALACITFMTPPLRWQREHRQWMNVREGLTLEISTDEGRIESALRDRFVLPESGSYLLLTDSLDSSRFVVIPVEGRDLVAKLEAIGDYAQRRPRRFPVNDPAFEAFLSQYDSVYPEETENGESIAKNLTDILAVDNLFYGSGDYDGEAGYVRSQAQSWIDGSLNRLLDRVDSQSGEDLDSVLRRYSDFLAFTLETCNASPERAPRPASRRESSYMTQYSMTNLEDPTSVFQAAKEYYIPGQYNPYLTDLSKKKMESFNCLLPFIMLKPAQRRMMYPDFLSASRVDYAPLGLYLGAIIEEELNASVVQLARKNAGIEMPRYYRIWDESNRDLPGINTGNGCIYLNGKSDRIGRNKYKVSTLGIGQTGLAVRLMREADPKMEFGRFGDDDFLLRLKLFSKCRNTADHPALFGKQAFLEAFRLFTDICQTDLKAMSTLKKSLMK